MFGRFVATTGGMFVALVGWVWLRAETAPTTVPGPTPASGACYAVDVSSTATTIELPDDLDRPCHLIVSSLGDPGCTYPIRLYRIRQSSTPPPPSLARRSLGLCTTHSGCVVQKPDSTEASSAGFVPSASVHGPSTVRGPASVPAMLREIAPLQWTRHRSTSPASTRAAALANLAPPNDSPLSLEAQVPSLTYREFHLHVAETALEDARGYTRVAATLVAEGRCVRVYSDTQVKAVELTPGLVEEIVHLLDERIIPRSREIVGVHTDVDGDGKLAVLLTPWLSRLQGGRTSVNGFVRSTDFQADGISPYSNRADVLYLNSALRPNADLAALLAHEYTHAVCCSLRLADGRRPSALPDEPDWLNEALAHVAERLHGAGWSNLDRRVEAFLEKSPGTPLVVPDYYRAGLWRDPACRGATYLFLQWCVDGYGGELLRELATGPQTGIEKLEAITGHSFATLFRHWTIALDRGALPSLDLCGQLGECRLAGPHRHAWDAAGGPLELELRGTAAAFVTCLAAEPRGKRRQIVIEAPSHARLQVTIAPASTTAHGPDFATALRLGSRAPQTGIIP